MRGPQFTLKKGRRDILSDDLITIDLNLVFRVLKIHNTLHWLSKIQHSYMSPTIYLTLDIDAKKVIIFSSPSNHKCKYRIEKGIYWTINVVLKFYKCFKHSYHKGQRYFWQTNMFLHCTALWEWTAVNFNIFSPYKELYPYDLGHRTLQNVRCCLFNMMLWRFHTNFSISTTNKTLSKSTWVHTQTSKNIL